jgi:hypothetical protein
MSVSGRPEQEAYYANVNPEPPVGEYQVTVREVPVDAFWSTSLHNPDRFFDQNGNVATSTGSVTAKPNDDGSITVNFGNGNDDHRANRLSVMEGWNYIVRLYQPPRSSAAHGRFPTLSAV